MKRFVFLIINIVLSVAIVSCQKEQDSQINYMDSGVLDAGYSLSDEVQDSLLFDYVKVDGIVYSLDITKDDAFEIGVTNDKYDETLEKIANLNGYLDYRRSEGDSIVVMLPHDDIAETRTLIRYDQEEDLLLYQGFVGNGGIYFMGPEYAMVEVSTSSAYYTVTFTFDAGTSSASYTVATVVPEQMIHIQNPNPALYDLPVGEELYSDYYNTHVWSLSMSVWGSGLDGPGELMFWFTRRHY